MGTFVPDGVDAFALSESSKSNLGCTVGGAGRFDVYPKAPSERRDCLVNVFVGAGYPGRTGKLSVPKAPKEPVDVSAASGSSAVGSGGVKTVLARQGIGRALRRRDCGRFCFHARDRHR